MRIRSLLIIGCLIAFTSPALAQRKARAGIHSHSSHTSSHHRHDNHARQDSAALVWVPAYDEVVHEEVWVPGHYESRIVSTRICGVLLSKTRRVWVAGHYECQQRVIHHPGYYKSVCRKQPRHSHVSSRR